MCLGTSEIIKYLLICVKYDGWHVREYENNFELKKVTKPSTSENGFPYLI